MRASIRISWLTAVMLMAFSACGPSDGNQDSVAAVCDSRCGYEERCDHATLDCRANCEQEAPPASIYRPGVLTSFATCLANLSCDDNDDKCLVDALAAQDPSWRQSPELQHCLDRHDQCGGFSDDLCPDMLLMTSAVQAAIDQCLDGPCAQIQSCLDVALPVY